MKFRLFAFFVFLTLTTVASARNATSFLPSQIYWNSVFHETPMPKALSELIQPDALQPVQPFEGYEDYYNPDGMDTLLKDPTQVVFFFEEKVHPGTTMKLSLARNSTASTFLSKKTAESIPFSTHKLPEILSKLSVKPKSSEAGIIKKTIETCERKTLNGEHKHCATSLESMIDFVTSKLGRNIRAVSTKVENGATLVEKGDIWQNYTITPGVKKLADADEDKLIVCHRKAYGYVVFLCHTFERTRAYLVPLRGPDMTNAQGVAICHLDTSQWNPRVLRALKVKPGTIPVCHFIPEGHFAWVLNEKPTSLVD